MTGFQKFLLAAIAVVAALHFVGGHDHERRNFEVMPEMLEPVPYESQGVNPAFPDGKTMRPPVPGTIARGFPALASKGLVLDARIDWKDLSAAQQDAWNALAAPPIPKGRTAMSVARGRDVFGAICATCHGPGAEGDGPVTKRGVPPPPSLLLPATAAKSDGHLYRIITAGQGNMAPHAAQVARADRWRLVRYLRTLQEE